MRALVLPRNSGGPAAWVLALAALALAIFGGLVIALSSVHLNALLFGVIGAAMLMVAPLPAVITALLVLTFVVVGNLQYFAKLQQALWIPYFLGGALYLRVFMVAASAVAQTAAPRVSWPAFVWLLFAFFACVCVSSIVNVTPAPQVLVGLKNYFFMWSVMFLVGAGALSAPQLARVWWWGVVVALLQLPFAVYQHFVVAVNRSDTLTGGFAWDSVVGTFGGDMEGGGASGTLALFLVIVMTFCLALWRAGLTSGARTSLVLGVCLVSVLLGEVKVFFVFVPVAIIALYGREMLRKPLRAVAGIIGITAALVALFIAYQQMYWTAAQRGTMSFERMVDRVWLSNFDPNMIMRQTGEVGRTASVVLWWRENARKDVLSTVIGQGPMASRASRTIGYGKAARKYPFHIALYTMPALLWDVGLLGFLALAATLLAGLWRARALARSAGLPPVHAAAMRTTAISLAFIFIALPYNRDAVDSPAVQTLLAFLLGYVLYWHNALAAGPRATGPARAAAASQ